MLVESFDTVPRQISTVIARRTQSDAAISWNDKPDRRAAAGVRLLRFARNDDTLRIMNITGVHY